MVVRLLQWNIWCKEDPKKIAETLASIDPDIACLQEIRPNANTIDIIKENTLLKEFYFHPAQTWHTKKRKRVTRQWHFFKISIN